MGENKCQTDTTIMTDVFLYCIISDGEGGADGLLVRAFERIV